MWIGFKRIVRSGFVGFWRNAYVSMAAIFVMTVALFVVGSTMLLDKLLGVSLENIQDKVDINVYFVTTAEQASIDNLQTQLQALPDVEEVSFTSREEALAQFREKHQNDETIMQGLDEVTAPPSDLIHPARQSSHPLRFHPWGSAKVESSAKPYNDRVTLHN